MRSGEESSGAELALREHLQRTAHQAPTFIPDLAGTLLRRRSAVRRRRRTNVLRGGLIAAAAVAVLGVVLAEQHGSAVNPDSLSGQPVNRMAPAPLAADPLSCPASIAAFRMSTTSRSIGRSLVPGAPTSVHACGYTPDVVGRTKYESMFSGSDVLSLVSDLDSMKARPVECSLDSSAPVLLRFGYDNGDEVDIVLTAGADCTRAFNGVLTRWTERLVPVPLLGAVEMSRQVSVPGTTAPGIVVRQRPLAPSDSPASNRSAATTSTVNETTTSNSK